MVNLGRDNDVWAFLGVEAAQCLLAEVLNSTDATCIESIFYDLLLNLHIFCLLLWRCSVLVL